MRKRLATPAKAESQGGGEEPLHVKHRPKTLKQVVGQDDVVKSLTAVLAKTTRPHAYIFTGPSGTGKTTLARIVAHMVGCADSNIIEADAATNNGIDNVRELTAGARYQGFGDSPNRAYILDEAHALSKSAWQALLKPIEEPAPHVYWFLCTTETGKIPDTIATRCSVYNLRAVKRADLADLVDMVIEAESLDPLQEVVDLVVEAAEGSPRRALTALATVAQCDTAAEAARLLETPMENAEIIDLCRALVGGKLSWTKLTGVLRTLDMPAESVRIVVANYLAACLMGAKTDKDAERLCQILYPFSKPFNTSDKMAPLLLAFGELVL